jgi:type I restriction enzyme, S subunit
MKPTKWPFIRLGEIAEFRNGLNYNKDNFGKGLKVVNVKDFQDRLVADLGDLEEINPDGVIREECFLKDGDIIFVRSNGNRELIGRSMFVKGVTEPVSHSAFSIKVRFCAKEVLPRFYAYVFRTALIRTELSNRGGGTNISNLNQDILNSLEVPKPSLATQQKIASILSAYDDLIENNTRRIAVLEAMAQAIYREWFVEFRFPRHEKVKLVDSPLGKIPEGWKIETLSDVCFLTMGQSPSSEFYNETGEGLPFHQGVTNFGERYPTHVTFTTVTNRLACKDDVLFSVRAPVGRLNIADVRLVVGRGVSAIRHKQGKQVFLFHQLKERFKEEDMMGGGTIFKSVTKEDMQKISLISPPAPLVAEFENTVGGQFLLYDNLTKKNCSLRQTRDLLLPKLISGQLDVENLDIEVGEPLAKAEV